MVRVWASGPLAPTATLIYTYTSASLSAGTADGLLVAQSTNGTPTTYAWDWASGVPELLSTGGARYLVGAETLGLWTGGSWYYYLPDALGSIRQAVDAAGAVAQAREWDPYGEEVGGAQAGLGYTGEWWDADVGLLYLRARWYDSNVGRFTSRDPIPLKNRWLYADANPVNRVDPTGYFSNEAIARSLGLNSFDEVIATLKGPDNYWDYPLNAFAVQQGWAPPHVSGRWGFLRLLQEAQVGNSLALIKIELFGVCHFHFIGQFHCAGGTVGIGRYENLKDFLNDLAEKERSALADMPWRRKIQAYYLNGVGFRDGSGTDLPDFATASVNLSKGILGVQGAYTVDRYGRAYLSAGPEVSLGIPVGLGYSEGYVHRWKGGIEVASQLELDQLVPGLSLQPVGGNLLWFSAGVQVNLDRTVDDYLTFTQGVQFIPGLSVGINVSYTWRLRNRPVGMNWDWVEDIPSYEARDVIWQGNSIPSGCGC